MIAAMAAMAAVATAGGELVCHMLQYRVLPSNSAIFPWRCFPELELVLFGQGLAVGEEVNSGLRLVRAGYDP